jgi:hypothetical protein
MPIVASGAVTQYRGVGFNQAQATVAGQKIMGIARRSGASGAELEVVSIGTAACEAGAAVAVGAALAMDSSGRVVTATTLTAALGTLVTVAGAGTVTVGAGGVAGAPTLSGGDLPQFIVGYAMNAATAAGDVIEVFLA